MRVPGLARRLRTPVDTRHVPSHAAVEQDGFVWAWGEPDAEPTRPPFALPVVEGPGAGEVVFRCDLECTLRAALENALDVPHTAFLHRGIFRGGTPRPITAVRRPVDDGVEVQYLGEPVGMGPIRLREDPGRTFDHWDRFFLPSIAQIEYAVDGMVPDREHDRPAAAVTVPHPRLVRGPLPEPPAGAVVRPVVRQQGKQILRQDAEALARQTERTRSFGGERYASTEIDLLGNAIWHLLRHAERAEQPDGGDGACRWRRSANARSCSRPDAP